MPSQQESMQTDEVQDMLNTDIDYKKWKKLRRLSKFVTEHYKVLVISVLMVVSLISTIYYFNKLIVMEQQVSDADAQIEAALQMRQNLVPALTMVVYQFIAHEKNIFLSAVDAREKSLDISEDMTELIKSVKGVSGNSLSSKGLSRLIAVAENYPQLVSSESYQLLISRIADVENQLFEKRIEYNSAVNLYNTYLSRFPVNITGACLGFRMRPYFKWTHKAEWSFITESDVKGKLPVSIRLHNAVDKGPASASKNMEPQ